MEPVKMTWKRGIVLLFVIATAAWAADEPQFAIRASHPDANGVTFQTAAGAMRIEACGDRVIHVVASPTSEFPSPKVPIVTQTCRANNLQVKVGKKETRLSTAAITVSVNAATGAVSFFSKDGKAVLAEPMEGGKTFDVASVAEMKTWQVQQSFLSPSDEAQYGLGQHQEGIFNVRGVPIRLAQANTNISIPFLLSSKGYGILWNNPSLTDFNPADQTVAIDPATGKGKFTTGPKGIYGFLLSSDNKNQLIVEVNGQHVIDLQNMWLATSASGFVELEANKEYEVSAKGGTGGVQLAVRPPHETTTFRSEVGQAIDYYFFYGPALNQVIADYPCFRSGLTDTGSAGSAITASRRFSISRPSSGSEKFPSTHWSRTGSTGANTAGAR
jgi:alpha-D-xyloside xylohydrolase